jgi:hypothetical protein
LGDKSTCVIGLLTSVTSVTPFEQNEKSGMTAVGTLNAAEARLWLDSDGNTYIGVWECADSPAVRAAAAMFCPSAKVLHLERPEVPLRLKVQAAKIARIDDARWRKL